MKIAIHQPQYFPWLGYFDKIRQADRFVILDDVQYKKNEWQNRNRLKTAQGWQWLTVPVQYHFPETIRQVKINNTTDWRHKHQQAFLSDYGKAPHYKDYAPFLESLYSQNWENLAELNIHVVRELLKFLAIKTPVTLSSEIPVSGAATDRLVHICQKLGADHYLSGAGGEAYLDVQKFKDAGIRLSFQEYKHPSYPQLFGEFVSHLSVMDLLLNCGPKSLEVLENGERKAA